MMTIDAGMRREAEEAPAAGSVTFSLAYTVSPTRSTRQLEMGSSAGARSASPVRRLKLA